MSSQAITKTNQTTGIAPNVPWRACFLQVLPDWQLSVKFNDGVTGIVDVSGLINNPDPGIYSALRDPAYFAKAYLYYGAVAWPNGADLAPDTMYKVISKTGTWLVPDE
jgi:hypothetical protein